MSKKIYTKQEIEILQKNPNVKAVSSISITYSPAFKIKAVKQSESGMTSTVIFEAAGLPENLVGKGTRENGKQKGSIEEQLEEAKVRIAYLEGNLDLVKKLESQERSVKNDKENVLKISERYELINSII